MNDFSFQSWARDLDLSDHRASTDWSSVFCIPFKTTRETKMQSFSYKLIYRLTPCNKYLCTITIKDSPVCSLCPEVDSIFHFFYRCVRIKPFWEWCEKYLDLSLLHLNEFEVLLGVADTEPNHKVKKPAAHLREILHKKGNYFIGQTSR